MSVVGLLVIKLMSQMGPGCVKTCTSRECTELFSLFSSFDDDCQSGSSVIQCNRDKPSTLKFDIGVFTQPGSFPHQAVIVAPLARFRRTDVVPRDGLS